jgi:histone acetyltransferase
VTHLITFADNNAVGYFQKQGFTKEILMEREKWSGYIKEYDGGTLMECLISGAVLPADFPRVIKLQREAVEVCDSHAHTCSPLPACLA